MVHTFLFPLVNDYNPLLIRPANPFDMIKFGRKSLSHLNLVYFTLVEKGIRLLKQDLFKVYGWTHLAYLKRINNGNYTNEVLKQYTWYIFLHPVQQFLFLTTVNFWTDQSCSVSVKSKDIYVRNSTALANGRSSVNVESNIIMDAKLPNLAVWYFSLQKESQDQSWIFFPIWKMNFQRKSTTAKKRAKFKPSSFIKIYFEFAYYTCTCPFRMAKCANSGIFYSKTWKPQQVCKNCPKLID